MCLCNERHIKKGTKEISRKVRETHTQQWSRDTSVVGVIKWQYIESKQDSV